MKWDNINKEIQNWEEKHLDSFPSYAPTQKEIIELIEYYWISKYRDGDSDNAGYKKGFYNVVEHASLVASKMIDVDTKDVKIEAEDGQSYYPSWLLGKEFRLWAKSERNEKGQKFGQFLNQMVSEFPKYGHLLAKKAKGNVHLVPVKNVICQPDAESFLKSDYLIEKHEYTPLQLKNMGWDNAKVKEVLDINDKKEKICVYERYGKVKGSDSYNYYIMAEGYDEPLVKESIDDLYKELKWDDVRGRALGRGQVERLFENQIAKNLFENLMRTGLRWTSKHYWQTRDPKFTSNLLDAENGRVFVVQSEVNPISMEERNLPAYNFMDTKWNINTQDRGFVHEPLSGQRAPAGTTLGAQILQVQQAGQYYALRREDLGMFIEDIITDWIMPSFKSKKYSKHAFMTDTFTEEELDKFVNLIVEKRFNEGIFRQIRKTGSIPSTEERQALKAIVKKQVRSQKDFEVPDDYYKNLKYKVKVDVSGESVDSVQKLNALEKVLVLVGQNPALLQDRNFRKLLFQSMEIMGISPTIFSQDSADLENMAVAPPTGSVARTPAQTPQTSLMQTQV